MFSAQMPFTVLSENFISGFNESAAVSDAAAFTRAVTFYAEPSASPPPDYGVEGSLGWGRGRGLWALVAAAAAVQ